LLTVADVFKQPRLRGLVAAVATQKEATDERLTDIDTCAETGSASAYLMHDVLSQLQNIGARPSDVLPETNFHRLCVQGHREVRRRWPL
jgi:hypothetical protein